MLAIFEHDVNGTPTFPIYRSTDGGVSWTKISEVSDTDKGLTWTFVSSITTGGRADPNGSYDTV